MFNIEYILIQLIANLELYFNRNFHKNTYFSVSISSLGLLSISISCGRSQIIVRAQASMNNLKFSSVRSAVLVYMLLTAY